jgi:hypothetical protein
MMMRVSLPEDTDTAGSINNNLGIANKDNMVVNNNALVAAGY